MSKRKVGYRVYCVRISVAVTVAHWLCAYGDLSLLEGRRVSGTNGCNNRPQTREERSQVGNRTTRTPRKPEKRRRCRRVNRKRRARKKLCAIQRRRFKSGQTEPRQRWRAWPFANGDERQERLGQHLPAAWWRGLEAWKPGDVAEGTGRMDKESRGIIYDARCIQTALYSCLDTG